MKKKKRKDRETLKQNNLLLLQLHKENNNHIQSAFTSVFTKYISNIMIRTKTANFNNYFEMQIVR